MSKSSGLEWFYERTKRDALAAIAVADSQAKDAGLPTYSDLLNELREIREWAIKEKAPLRQQEIDSITRLISKAEGKS